MSISERALAVVHSAPSLARYDAACKALADARSVDEVKDVRDKSEAMRAYARQAKNKQLEIDAAEIRIRAERRIGELMEAQRDGVGFAKPGPKEIGSDDDPNYRPALADVGIDKHLADRARKLAAVPKEEFDGMVGEWRERVEQENERVTINLLKAGERHVRGTFGSGDNEWYTPEEYLNAARDVLGAIDLDPASSAAAQKAVGAKRFFSEKQDGLKQEWRGRVWLNPPYAQPLISEFVSKMVAERRAENVSAAIMLTHNYTDTAWFHEAASLADAICFTRGRVKFIDENGEEAAPTQGQAFFYFGDDVPKFADRFASVGFVVTPHKTEK